MYVCLCTSYTVSAQNVYLRYLYLQRVGRRAVCGTDFPRAIEPSTTSNEENLHVASKRVEFFMHVRVLLLVSLTNICITYTQLEIRQLIYLKLSVSTGVSMKGL